jgi:hypothetical protein
LLGVVGQNELGIQPLIDGIGCDNFGAIPDSAVLHPARGLGDRLLKIDSWCYSFSNPLMAWQEL